MSIVNGFETISLTGKEEKAAVIAKAEEVRAGEARAVLVTILPEDQASEEKALLLLRTFCQNVCLPVYASGVVKRFEDIKKRIYAGCEGFYADPAYPAEPAALEEAVGRFGKDRIVYTLPDPAVTVAGVPWSDLKTDPQGLVPCIVTEEESGDVLMLAYMNEESFDRTLATGRMTYWSRSRQELWTKGETSGHYQFLRKMDLDCDKDTLLATVRQIGPACHTGAHSCFYTTIFSQSKTASSPEKILRDVYHVIADRKEHPKEGSYTNYLFSEGLDKILKKFSEEAAETVIAAKNPERQEIVYEMADLLYHMMVLMNEKDVRWEDIAEELAHRE